MRIVALLVLLVAICGACVPVRPLQEIQRTLTPGDLLEIDGYRVHARVRGAGDAVVLVHGFGASSYAWRKVEPELARRYRVVAPDLYGFGYTDRPRDLLRYTRSGQAALIVQVLDALGIERAHLVGHSYGGGLAMTVAAAYPERVHSVVLVDSTPPDWADTRRKPLVGRRPLSFLFVRGLALRPRFVRRVLERSLYDDRLVTDDLVAGYRERLRFEGAARGYRGLTAPRRSEAEPMVRYEDLDLPALVIWGSEDALVSPEQGRVHAERMPRHEFVEIESAGHAPMEERPEAFLSHLLRFLEANPLDGGGS